MPRGHYDRSPEAAEARRLSRESLDKIYAKAARKPAKRAGINIGHHLDAKFGDAGIRVEVLPTPVPTMYMKVELPEMNDDSEYLEDFIKWVSDVRDKLSEYGRIREMVVTDMPSTMKVIV